MRLLNQLSLSVCGVYTRLPASLACRYGQKVALIKKMGQLHAWERWLIIFSFFFFWFKSCISLTAALTNMILGREIKLCDVTNIVMVKHVFLGKPQKTVSANTFLMAYVCACN